MATLLSLSPGAGVFGAADGLRRCSATLVTALAASTLVASLLTMGLSTVAIGLLPSYEQIGLAAPLLLCVFRIGQGIGLGGEWGGAALVATENAPAGKRGWFGSFPQLGAPIGLFAAMACSSSSPPLLAPTP